MNIKARAIVLGVYFSLSSVAWAEPLKAVEIRPFHQPITLYPVAGWQSNCVARQGGVVALNATIKIEDQGTKKPPMIFNFDLPLGSQSMQIKGMIHFNNDFSMSFGDVTTSFSGFTASKEEEEKVTKQISSLFNLIMRMAYGLKTYGVPYTQNAKFVDETAFANMLKELLKGLSVNAEISSVKIDLIAKGTAKISQDEFLVFEGPIEFTVYNGDRWVRSIQNSQYLYHIQSGLSWERYKEEVKEGPGYREVKTTNTECTFLPPSQVQKFPGPAQSLPLEPAESSAGHIDVVEKLRTLRNLQKQGLITQKDFEAQKKKLLEGF